MACYYSSKAYKKLLFEDEIDEFVSSIIRKEREDKGRIYRPGAEVGQGRGKRHHIHRGSDAPECIKGHECQT